MPATKKLIGWERDDRDGSVLDGCVACCLVMLCIGVPIAGLYGIAHGFYLWLFLETGAGLVPRTAFRVAPICNVLTVTHAFNSSEQPVCTDAFIYTWKFEGSPVVYIEEEVRSRVAADCSSDLGISALNATFQNGTNNCFTLRNSFANYADFFSCAQVLNLNNGTEGRCTTLFEPSSTYDAIPNIVLAIFLILLLLFLLVRFCGPQESSSGGNLSV